MFDNAIINTDRFMDMPLSAKALYFLLGMEADDYGFVSPRRVMKLHGNTDDDLKILISKQYVIYFKSGVVVITDWKKNNWLDKRRTKQTEFTEELKLLETFENKYILKNAKPMLSECLASIEEKSIEENSIEEKSNICSNKNLNDTYQNEFKTLWNLYPNKKGKQKALSSYLRERKKTSYKTILNGLNDYIKYLKIEKVKPPFIKNGSTWFNQKCWEDDYTIKRKLTTKDLAKNIDWSDF